ncbi:hypothetical protein J6590_073194 [Homalodisca vitripennis]|nr:hypothetical protein J6590_073194 [Homalodisca vitripennis]
MLLTPLLVVATCVTEAFIWKTWAAPFNFREKCQLMHLDSKFFATCNGKRVEGKSVDLNGRATEHMSGVNLTSFQSVTFDSSVKLRRISVSKTSQVSLFLSNPQLTDLQIDNVDELTLKYQHERQTLKIPYIANMALNNINTLRLIGNAQEFVWSIRIVNLVNVGDMDLGSTLLKIFAENVLISKTKIRLHNKASLVFNASSIAIDNSVIYIHENGFLNATVNQITVRDSHINLESGCLNLVNAREALFTKNSLHGFNNRPLIVHDNAGVRFEENDIFTHDIGGVLRLSNGKVIFRGNNFGCYDCLDNRILLDSDLQDSGDVNYCYTSCNLTLNTFKKYLADSYFCTEGVLHVGQDWLCNSNMNSPKAFEYFYFLWWIPIVLINLLLIICLVFWICRTKKRKKLKVTALNNVKPQELRREPPHQIAFNNVCYDDIDSYLDHGYEQVEPVTCR